MLIVSPDKVAVCVCPPNEKVTLVAEEELSVPDVEGSVVAPLHCPTIVMPLAVTVVPDCKSINLSTQQQVEPHVFCSLKSPFH